MTRHVDRPDCTCTFCADRGRQRMNQRMNVAVIDLRRRALRRFRLLLLAAFAVGLLAGVLMGIGFAGWLRGPRL